MLKTFYIYFGDLTKDAQRRLCEEFQTSPEQENWDAFYLVELEREVEHGPGEA
jgi:hypothetical protein